MKTSSRLSLPLWLITAGLATILMLSAQTSMAQHGSATWLASPPNNIWGDPLNWTSGGPPNGPSDTATFANSNSLSPDAEFIEVNGIIFSSGASAYGIATATSLTISGVGITNLSGITQNLGGSGSIIFTNSASAGSRTAFDARPVYFYNNSTAAYGTFTEVFFYDSSTAGNATLNGGTFFYDNSSAANATFSSSLATYFSGNSSAGGATFSDCDVYFYSSSTASNAIFTTVNAYFSDSSTAANGSFLNAPVPNGIYGVTEFGNFSSAGSATITNNGGTVGGANGGGAIFLGSSTAYNATITNNGGTVSGAYGGGTSFGDTSTAGNATLIANGGTGGGEGGAIVFGNAATGGTARVEVFGNGSLNIGNDQGSVIIGSIEGTGNVLFHYNADLTVGSNNLSTIFSGVIQDYGLNRLFAKIGSGILTFQGRPNNDYIAATVTLSLVSNSIINLNFTGAPDTIASLVVNGVPQTPGVYGGPGSGAPHQLPEFAGTGTVQVTQAPHPAFFTGETALGNGVYYLQFPNGTPFGYYSYLTDPFWIYHFDMGYEYWFDANDGQNGIYFYDNASTHFFYTSPSFPFPYLYDFTLNTVLYYYPDTNNPGHYTTNPRYFYNFATGQIITM